MVQFQETTIQKVNQAATSHVQFLVVAMRMRLYSQGFLHFLIFLPIQCCIVVFYGARETNKRSIVQRP